MTEENEHTEFIRKVAPHILGFRLYLERVPIPKIAARLNVTPGTVQGWHKRHSWPSRRDKVRQWIDEAEVRAIQRVISEAKPRFVRRTVDLIDRMQDEALGALDRGTPGDLSAATRLAGTAHQIAKDLYGQGSPREQAGSVDAGALRALAER